MADTSTSRILHMGVAVEWMRSFLMAEEREGQPQTYITTEEGPVSYAAALTYLAQLEADGFECIPSCDNHDATGRCRGHS